MEYPRPAEDGQASQQMEPQEIRERLGSRSIVLIGMMGAGKSSVGRRVAARLDVPFVDADHEIEAAAGMTIPEIFERHGEAVFRDGERKVIRRLLETGPQVLATGGGAWMAPETREAVARHGISVWLRAEVDVLLRRVRRRQDRPLLKGSDQDATLRKLIEIRGPVYATADRIVESRDVSHEVVVRGRAGRGGGGPRGGAAAGQAGARRGMNEARHPASELEVVGVELGARRYDIVIGPQALDALGDRLAALSPGGRAMIVTDRNVAACHLERLEMALAGKMVLAPSIVVPPGESTKCFAELERVLDEMLDARIERGDIVVALGGGVVGDLAGFAAAILRRGVRYVQVPTSLLAQVDSSVGGKTGIDTRHGKNLVGAFHQPALVVADTSLLDTLSPREFRAGYAEVAKYGLIDAASFFEWLERSWTEIFEGGPARRQAIAASCRAKARIVANDERESGQRALLNLGHTFGHALEAATGFSQRLVHGEGVAIGMVLAFGFSARLGLCAAADEERVRAHLAAVGLPTALSHIEGEIGDADTLLDLITQDKKVERGSLTFILTRGIGQAFVAKDVAPDAVRDFLAARLNER